ncbi:MAG: glycosyltransferase family 39 protein [Elusimicrobiales bacterium]|nr:glycosyltransferase family 39 protein [Elusimicrobiales bacterium]
MKNGESKSGGQVLQAGTAGGPRGAAAKLRAFFGGETGFAAAVFLFALVLRLAYSLPLPPDKLSQDAFGWMDIGWDIARGLGVGNSWRPPGYSYFLAFLFVIFGKSVLAIRAAQALLGAFTCVLLYKTGKRLFSENAGRLAAVMLSFYPYAIAYSGDALSETFLMFMIVVSVFFTVKTSQEPGWKNILATGVLYGLTGLTKSTTLPFFVLACAWLWWNTRSFRVGLLVGLCTLGAILPWSLRNYFHFDKSYVMPVNTPWCHLYGSSCDTAFWSETMGELSTPQSIEQTEPAIPEDWRYLMTLPLPERDKICKQKAKAWISENPDKLLALCWLRFKHFWRLYPMMAYPWQKYAAMATSGLYLPLAFFGLLLSWRQFKKTSLLVALFGSYTLVHLFFVVVLRYRVPIDPFLMLLAAYAVTAVWERLRPTAQETNSDWDRKWEVHKTSKAEAWIASRRDGILDACLDKLPGTKKVLEVGCGSGINLKRLKAARADAECWALDNSPVAVERLKKDFPLAVAGDCLKTPFADGQFDLVYSAGVLEHLGDEAVFFAEMRRILKDGGLLVTFVPARYSLWRVYQLLLHWFAGNDYEKSYTYGGLAALSAAGGFEEEGFYGLDPFSVQGAVMKIFNVSFDPPVKSTPFKSAYTEICLAGKKKPGRTA